MTFSFGMPSLPGCAVDGVRQTTTALIVSAHTTSTSAICPACGCTSQRVHSQYVRTPCDLPIGDEPLRLVLQVRRFFCDQPNCPKRTFAEPLPDLLPMKAQRTARLTQTLLAVAHALGGEASARLGKMLRMPLSADTFLRILRTAPVKPTRTPRVLGVDDFAFRKRHTYGTLLVDLEQRRPVDMLPDRRAETLATWLREHPGVEVIARDRSTDYARGAADGAPQATQVADRWHLLQNVREAMERTLTSLRPHLHQPPSDASTQPSTPPRPRLKPVSASELARRHQHREERYARYERVHQLARAGVSHREIARRLGIHRSTVVAFVRAPAFPERSIRQPLPSLLDPYMAYLQQRWQEGEHNSSQLWREIQAKGYTGGRIQVARWAQTQRTTPAPTTPHTYRAAQAKGTGAAHLVERLPSTRQLAWLAVRDAVSLADDERALLERLQENTVFTQAYDLVQRFVRLVHTRDASGFSAWLRDCQSSGVNGLRTFAQTLLQDEAAVRAALAEPWSTGQVEGQITRVKLLKRQMYGRASFDLLRLRVLHTD